MPDRFRQEVRSLWGDAGTFGLDQNVLLAQPGAQRLAGQMMRLAPVTASLYVLNADLDSDGFQKYI